MQRRNGAPRDTGGAVQLTVVVIAVAIRPTNLVRMIGEITSLLFVYL